MLAWSTPSPKDAPPPPSVPVRYFTKSTMAVQRRASSNTGWGPNINPEMALTRGSGPTRVGAGVATAEAVPSQQPSDPSVLTKIFDHIQRNADDQKNQGEGTMGYLKSPNRFLVYLARGCDEYKV